jgi:hypothetical protein
MRPQQRTVPPLLRLAPLVVALFAIGQLAAVLHFVQHRHVWCTVHHAFEHASTHGGAHECDAAEGHDAARPSGPVDRDGRGSGAPCDGEGDRCRVPADVRHGFAWAPARPVMTIPPRPATPIAALEEVPPRAASRTPWLLAPKNSPPA